MYRLGTRKSALAGAQSEYVQKCLEKEGVRSILYPVESTGDQDPQTPLYEFELENPGLFTKQLEVALLNDEIDFAVHSLKDLPTDQPSGLRIASIPPRMDSNDCLILSPATFHEKKELGLPNGAKVGTSSLRREALLLSCRGDLNVVPIRGNVPTRVQAVREGKVDAIVLAHAGILRLERKLDLSGLLVIPLPSDVFVSAPGQGALAIETRQAIPDDLKQGLERIHHPPSETETRVERSILRELHGGCTLPLGVRCQAENGELRVRAFLGLNQDRQVKAREWLSFHRFDICELSEETLVRKAVAHFRDVMHAR